MKPDTIIKIMPQEEYTPEKEEEMCNLALALECRIIVQDPDGGLIMIIDGVL